MYLLFFILFYLCHSPNQFPNSPVVFLFNFLFHSFSLLPLLSTSLPPLRLCPPTLPSFPFAIPITTALPSHSPIPRIRRLLFVFLLLLLCRFLHLPQPQFILRFPSLPNTLLPLRLILLWCDAFSFEVSGGVLWNSRQWVLWDAGDDDADAADRNAAGGVSQLGLRAWNKI